jgi:hypothetical protein
MESAADPLKERICDLVSRQCGIRPEKIGSASRLLHDLGIDGDDAAELLSDYSTIFAVDMSGFDFDRFFRGEPHLFNFLRFWFGSKAELLPLTVEDLYQSALHKKFVERASAT